MRILVVGKKGQVASAFARQNKNPDATCICLGRPDLDITNAVNIASALEKVKPDIVVNGSAYTAVDKAESEKEQAYEVNSVGVGLLARLTAERNVPLFHISTDYVFSGDQTGVYVELDKTGPTGVYGASKLAGEELVRLENAKHLIIRTSWVFDQTGSNFPKTMLRLASNRNEISVVSDQFGNPTDAEEIANAILAAAHSIKQNADKTLWGTYHFAGPQSVNWADFARMVMESSIHFGGPSALIRNITTAEYPTAAKRPLNSILNCEKFQNTFGYAPIPLCESIKRHMPQWLAAIAE